MRLVDPRKSGGFWKCLICGTLRLHLAPRLGSLEEYFDLMIDSFGLKEELVPQMMHYLCHVDPDELGPSDAELDEARLEEAELAEAADIKSGQLIDLSDSRYYA